MIAKRPLNIGKLDKRITFLVYDEDGTDELGQNKRGWVKSKTVWATFKPIRGGEFNEAEQKKREEVTYKATIRYRPGITSDLRIEYKGRIFEINSAINVDEADYMIEIECSEYVERSKVDINGV